MSDPRRAPPRAVIIGCEGAALSVAEEELFSDIEPLGFILFERNCRTVEQTRALIAALRAVAGADALILIDQEGGRVARLRPPEWRASPAAAGFAELYRRDRSAAIEAARLNARLTAAELNALGINVNCAPVLDIPVNGADPVIGDRALGDTPDGVVALGRAVCDGLLSGGVLPVIKHVPGHGRAPVDSHQGLPVVAAPRDQLEASDFVPFRALADLPIAMTAHVLYSAIDDRHPCTTSAIVIGEIVRTALGFAGLLLSDDLAMGALAGTLEERAETAVAAGCDVVLHRGGAPKELWALAGGAGRLSEAAKGRLASARARLPSPASLDGGAAARLDGLLAGERVSP